MGVVELKTFKSGCVDNLVDILKDSLERAQAGEFASGALILIRPDGSISCEYSMSQSIHAMVAGCAYLSHDIIKGANNDAEM